MKNVILKYAKEKNHNFSGKSFHSTAIKLIFLKKSYIFSWLKTFKSSSCLLCTKPLHKTRSSVIHPQTMVPIYPSSSRITCAGPTELSLVYLNVAP